MKICLRVCSAGFATFMGITSDISTVAVNGDFGISLLAYSTLILYSPGSFGVKSHSYPSGFLRVGISEFWPEGLIAVTLQGRSVVPQSLLMMLIFLVVPSGIAERQFNIIVLIPLKKISENMRSTENMCRLLKNSNKVQCDWQIDRKHGHPCVSLLIFTESKEWPK